MNNLFDTSFSNCSSLAFINRISKFDIFSIKKNLKRKRLKTREHHLTSTYTALSVTSITCH